MSSVEVRLADGGIAHLRLPDHGQLDPSEPWSSLRLASGQELLVPTEAISFENGAYHLPISLHDLGLELKTAPESVIIPVIEEELEVSRHTVDTEVVKVLTKLEHRDAVVEELLMTEQVEIDRVSVDREVAGPQPVRYEGDLVIIPVVEEVLVVSKRFVLKEEIRVRRRLFDVPTRQEFQLRRQSVEVVREPLERDQ